MPGFLSVPSMESAGSACPSLLSPSSPAGSPLGCPSSLGTTPDMIEPEYVSQEASSTPLDGHDFIMVIGGLGYIGSHTVLELLREDYNVIIVDNLSNSFETVQHTIRTLAQQYCKAHRKAMPLIHFHPLDYRSQSMSFLLNTYSDVVAVNDPLTGASQVTHRSRITGVIHFAAFKSVSESIAKPLAYYQNNVCGLVSLLERLDRHGIHNFIFSSSATVYGTSADLGRPLAENDLVHFPTEVDGQLRQPGAVGLTCPYARTKYFGEAILADVAEAQDDWRIVALRYFNPVGCDSSGLMGENPRAAPTNLYPVLTRVLTGGQPELNVFGSDWSTRDGTAIRDFIHVLDVARGHIAALRWNSTKGDGFRAFNLGSGTGTTVLEAVKSLQMAAGREIPLNWTGRRPGDVGVCVASTEFASGELQWKPRESVAQCAADLWNFVSKTLGMEKPLTV